MKDVVYARKGYVDESLQDTEQQFAEEDKDDESSTSKSDHESQISSHTKPRVSKIRRLDPRRLEAIERKLRPRQNHERAALRRAPSPTGGTAVPISYSVLRCLRWMESTTRTMVSIFYAVGTILGILAIPLLLVALLFMAFWAFDAVLIASKPNFCWIPGISSLEICDVPVVSPKPTISPAMQNALEYSSKLEEMQTLGADSVALPYYLRIAEGGIRGMIVQLSAVDLPTKQVVQLTFSKLLSDE
jgi:hypothetical protein